MIDANLYIHSMPTQPIFIEIETKGDLPELHEDFCFYPTLASKLMLIQEDYHITDVYMNTNPFSRGIKEIIEQACGLEVKEIEVEPND